MPDREISRWSPGGGKAGLLERKHQSNKGRHTLICIRICCPKNCGLAASLSFLDEHGGVAVRLIY